MRNLLCDIQQFTLLTPSNSIPTPILLRSHHLPVVGSVSHPRLVQRIPLTTRNIMFQDTASPLKAKDGRSIFAFYPVRLDTNIKLEVSWNLIDEGLHTEY